MNGRAFALGLRVRVLGADAVMRKLSGLETRVRNKVLRTALREAMRPMHSAAKDAAPVRSGRGRRRQGLRKTIVLRRAAFLKGKRNQVGFEVSTGKSHKVFAGRKGGFYGAFVNLGHRARDGRKVRGSRFLQRAFRRTAGRVERRALELILAGTLDAYRKG